MSRELPAEIALEAAAERIAQEEVDGLVEMIGGAVRCNACGSTFPPSEAHRDSNGYCECGGMLVYVARAAAVRPASPEWLEITVVKDG